MSLAERRMQQLRTILYGRPYCFVNDFSCQRKSVRPLNCFYQPSMFAVEVLYTYISPLLSLSISPSFSLFLSFPSSSILSTGSFIKLQLFYCAAYNSFTQANPAQCILCFTVDTTRFFMILNVPKNCPTFSAAALQTRDQVP